MFMIYGREGTIRMKKDKILLVEDEEGIRKLIQLYLEKCGYIVFPAENGEDALQIVDDENPDLILLDIEMPKMNGFDICKKIRQKVNVPIIFISSRREVTDKVKSFELGGDDYITKPFDFEELEARIKANIRRYIESEDRHHKNVLKYKNLEINLDSYECFIDGNLLTLSTREMEILILLAKNPNQVWSAEKLYDHIWGFDSYGDIQTIKVHISNLRRKLAPYASPPGYIKTVRGFGYKLSV